MKYSLYNEPNTINDLLRAAHPNGGTTVIDVDSPSGGEGRVEDSIEKQLHLLRQIYKPAYKVLNQLSNKLAEEGDLFLAKEAYALSEEFIKIAEDEGRYIAIVRKMAVVAVRNKKNIDALYRKILQNRKVREEGHTETLKNIYQEWLNKYKNFIENATSPHSRSLQTKEGMLKLLNDYGKELTRFANKVGDLEEHREVTWDPATWTDIDLDRVYSTELLGIRRVGNYFQVVSDRLDPLNADLDGVENMLKDVPAYSGNIEERVEKEIELRQQDMSQTRQEDGVSKDIGAETGGNVNALEDSLENAPSGLADSDLTPGIDSSNVDIDAAEQAGERATDWNKGREHITSVSFHSPLTQRDILDWDISTALAKGKDNPYFMLRSLQYAGAIPTNWKDIEIADPSLLYPLFNSIKDGLEEKIGTQNAIYIRDAMVEIATTARDQLREYSEVPGIVEWTAKNYPRRGGMLRQSDPAMKAWIGLMQNEGFANHDGKANLGRIRGNEYQIGSLLNWLLKKYDGSFTGSKSKGDDVRKEDVGSGFQAKRHTSPWTFYSQEVKPKRNNAQVEAWEKSMMPGSHNWERKHVPMGTPPPPSSHELYGQWISNYKTWSRLTRDQKMAWLKSPLSKTMTLEQARATGQLQSVISNQSSNSNAVNKTAPAAPEPLGQSNRGLEGAANVAERAK